MEYLIIRRSFYCILPTCIAVLWKFWLWVPGLDTEFLLKIPLFLCLSIQESNVEHGITLSWQSNYLQDCFVCFPILRNTAFQKRNLPEEGNTKSKQTCCSLTNRDHSVLVTWFCYLQLPKECKSAKQKPLLIRN